MQRSFHIMTEFIVLLALVFWLTACDKQSITGVGNQPVEPNFESIQQNILTPGCAVSGCHVGNNPPAGLNLQAGQAFQNLVNAASTEDRQRLRVKPNDADNSYLFRKIAGNAGIAGSRMPIGGRLNDQQINAVRDWINAGAANN